MSLYNYLKDNGAKIHYWGLGFVQVRINEDVNYHFYTDMITAHFDIENPHNHARDFTSEILAGELQEIRYNIEESSHGLRLVSNFCTVGVIEDTLVKIIDMEPYTHTRGDTYTCDKGIFHTVMSTNCVTKLTKTGERGQVYSVVMDKLKDDVESGVIYPEDFLWGIVREICDEHSL